MFKFKAEQRVKKRSSFLLAQKNGRKLRTGSFLVCVFKSDLKNNEHLLVSRLGITVTTKVDKLATKRNTLKRRIREVFRLNYPDIKKGFDFVVIAQVGATSLSFEDIKTEILSSLAKASLMRPTPTISTK